MKQRLPVVFGLVLVLGLWLAGCSKDNGPTSTNSGISATDQATLGSAIAVEQLLGSDPTYLNDGNPTLAKVDTAIFPWAWGRLIDTSTFVRNVSYATMNDSTVQATVTTSYSGTFWVRGSFTLQGAHQTFTKPFSETFTRIVTFFRVTNPNTPNIKWRLGAISAAKGGTANPGFSITNVTFTTPAGDSVVITDPNGTNLWVGRMAAAGGLPTLSLSDSSNQCRIYATVISSSPDSDFVTLHHPYWLLGWHYRQPMRLISSVDNGDGTFTRVYMRTWHVALVGRHHLMVSVVSRGTILDNVAPVKTQVWGVPIIVN